MNAWSLIFLTVILAGAVYADPHGGRRNHHRKTTPCADARVSTPFKLLGPKPDVDSGEIDDDGVLGYDDTGRLTLFCWSGCCDAHRDQTCCSNEYFNGKGSHERHHDDDDDDDRREHKHQKKTLIIVAIVAGVLSLIMLALAIGVCILKKKARRVTRVQNSRTFTVPYMTGLGDWEKKQPLPAGPYYPWDEKVPGFMEPYIIKGVPPPAYNTQPDTPQPIPDAPPSYSTLSLHEAARESPTPNVVNVKPATPEKF